MGVETWGPQALADEASRLLARVAALVAERDALIAAWPDRNGPTVTQVAPETWELRSTEAIGIVRVTLHASKADAVRAALELVRAGKAVDS